MSSAHAIPRRGLMWRVLLLWVLHAVAVLGAVAAPAGAYYLRSPVPSQPPKPQTQVTTALIGVGVLALMLQWLVPGQMALSARLRAGRQLAQNAPEGASPEQLRVLAGDDLFWAARYQTGYLVRLAILEVGVLALALAHLLEGPPDPIKDIGTAYALWGSAVFVLLILWLFPTRMKVLYWAHEQRARVLQDYSAPSEGGGLGLF